jgi:hypothetical protein
MAASPTDWPPVAGLVAGLVCPLLTLLSLMDFFRARSLAEHARS